MTQQFKIGDLVQFTKGEEVRRGRVRKFGMKLALGERNLDFYGAEGWSGTLIEAAKPAVVLPTEPGWYLDKRNNPWELQAETADYEQRWFIDGQFQTHTTAAMLAPFTRLAPVAETAQKIIDRIDYPQTGFLSVQMVKKIIRNEFVGDK
jgi:hypothetical protein